MRRSMTTTLFLVLLTAAAALHGAQDPVQARGFSGDKLYDVGDIDAVDQFNGNLNVSIPIGPKYVTNGALSYQFSLVYNSGIWDFVEIGYAAGASPIDVERLIDNPAIVDAGIGSAEGIFGVEAVPAPENHAGLGWNLTLGQPKFIQWDRVGSTDWARLSYVTADGAEHTFWTDLHGPASGGPSNLQAGNGPFYTRDGTYLRMTIVDPTHREITFPDGVVHRISCADCMPSGANGTQWYLDEIADPLGAVLTITRSSDARPPVSPSSPTAQWNWTYTESFAATEGYAHGIQPNVVRRIVARHLVRMRRGGTGQGLGQVQVTLESLEVPAPNQQRSTIRFVYQDRNLHLNSKTSWGDPNPANRIVPFAYDSSVGPGGLLNTWLLRRIEFPDSAATWKFRYWDDGVDGDAAVLDDDLGDGLTGPDFVPSDLATQTWGPGGWQPYTYSGLSGLLAEVILPTGGGTQYTYGARGIPSGDCGARFRDRWNNVTAVVRRQQTQISTTAGASVRVPSGRPWLYFGAAYQANAQDCAKELTSVSIDPQRKATVSFHSIYIGGDPEAEEHDGWTRQEYGLPITRHDRRDDMMASTYTYDCSAVDFTAMAPDTLRLAVRGIVDRNRFSGQAATCLAADPDHTGTALDQPLRKTYQRWEFSGVVCDFGAPSCSQTNRRLQKQADVFDDVCVNSRLGSSGDERVGCTRDSNTETMRVVEKSDFDGLGHYRRQLTSGTFYKAAFPNSGATGDQRDRREEVTRYNPNLTFNAATFTVSPALPTTWILGMYDSSSATQLSVTTRREFGFDPATGRLVVERRLKGAQAGDNDLLSRALRSIVTGDDGRPRVQIRREYFGGDQQCLNISTEAATTSTLAGGSIGIPRYRIETLSWSGEPTRIDYKDPANGSTVIEPMLDASIDYETALITRTVDSRGKQIDFAYDSLGRMLTLTPEAEVPTRIEYPHLAAGDTALVKATRTSDETPSSRDIDVLEFDPWGRVASMRRSVDGTMSRTISTWSPMGLRLSQSTEGSDGASQPGWTYFDYDLFGRTWKVKPPDGDSKAVRTSYYGVRAATIQTLGVATGLGTVGSISRTQSSDVFGRTIKVDEAPTDGTTSYDYDVDNHLVGVRMGAQTRTFTYDRRGLLVSERLPELAPFDIQYLDFDARGNFKTRILRKPGENPPSHREFDLEYIYDKAERLSLVRAGSPLQPIKGFEYDGGRVVAAHRVNYTIDPYANGTARQYTVSNHYDYDDAGRLITKTVNAGFSASIGYRYNDLGAVKTVFYPTLRECDTCPSVGSGRTIDYTWNGDQLKTVQIRGGASIISATSYFRNGLTDTVTRGDGTTDVQTITVNQPRPSSVSTTGRWNSGTIAYDGFGNIKAIGDDQSFAYDGFGRLTKARLGGGAAQDQTYDRYGNIIATTRTGPNGIVQSASLATDDATNRLLPPPNTPSDLYDVAGNLVRWRDTRLSGSLLSMQFDPFNMATSAKLQRTTGNSTSTLFGRVFVYDADDERVGVLDYSTASGASATNPISERWTLRGAAGDPIADFTHANNAAQILVWSHAKDYVSAAGRSVAEILPNNTIRHLHADHLGSIRCVTVNGGPCTPARMFFPFGEELAPAGDDSRIRFAGHERDDNQLPGFIGDIDYMHARYYNAAIGRFLSLDPTWSSADIARPQTWNRYSYVVNNPVRYRDPDGRCVDVVSCTLEGGSLAGPAGAAVGAAVGIGVVYAGSKVDWREIGESLMRAGSKGSADSSAGERFAENWIRQNNAIQMAKRQNAEPADLPARDRTGKVHGDLPTLDELRKHSSEDLREFEKELEGSVDQRIRTTSQLGPEQKHGERQGEEQRLIKQIDRILEERGDQ